MGLVSRLGSSHVTLDDATANDLAKSANPFRTVEVHPPFDAELPVTLDKFVKAVTEYQTAVLGVRNTSPTVAFEIQRFEPSRLRLQFVVRMARMERKLRTHLAEEIPEIGFSQGVDGLPITEDDTVGVGVLTLRRPDTYPLQTDFDTPPTNSVIAALHQHAMRDTRMMVQILFKPMAGHPVGKRLWHREASRESRILRSDKVGFFPWQDRQATPRENNQARQIDKKAGSPRHNVSVRILVIGAGEYTASRVKEISGGFNVFADTETGQSFKTTVVQSLRDRPILKTVERIRDRDHSHRFQLSIHELAALVSIPDRDQENLTNAV